MKKLLFDALKTKYVADQLDALARFSVYSENAVGIGEHPQITEEMNNLVQQYVDATDKLSGLNEMIVKINELSK